LQALVSCHGFWLFLLLPPAVVLRKTLMPGQRRLVGTVLAGLGILALLGLAVYETLTWLPITHSLRYFPHRILFVTATTVEIPACELLLAGLFLRWSKTSTVVSAVRTFDEDENRNL
jgi:hypothetical protein